MSKKNIITLDALSAVIAERMETADPECSYTARLKSRGREKIAQKLGEEAVELVIVAMKNKKKEMVSESADLLYHFLVLLADAHIPIEKVMKELSKREGVSGLVEKASRTD